LNTRGALKKWYRSRAAIENLFSPTVKSSRADHVDEALKATISLPLTTIAVWGALVPDI
jgi:hypothetical protein